MANKMIYTITFVMMLCSLISCVKDPQDIPPGVTSDPIFGLKGTFGTEVIDARAGQNDWTFIPTVSDVDNINLYTSMLSKAGCLSDCAPSWSFKFYEASGATQSEEQKLLNTVHTGNIDLALADALRDSFQIAISTHPEIFMNGVSFWQDSSGTTFNHELFATVGSQDIFNACFQSVTYAGCQYNQCVSFNPTTLVPCLVHIEAKLDGNHVILTAKPEGTPPFQIQWQDGFSSQNIVISFQDSIAEIVADVTVTDANGNRAELVQTIRVQNGVVDACYFPISLQSTLVTNTSAALAAGDLEIAYRDESGALWSSTGKQQPSTSSVVIQQVEYFGLSPYGQRTYKLIAAVHVLLTNSATGESKWLDSQDLVLPVAHP